MNVYDFTPSQGGRPLRSTPTNGFSSRTGPCTWSPSRGPPGCGRRTTRSPCRRDFNCGGSCMVLDKIAAGLESEPVPIVGVVLDETFRRRTGGGTTTREVLRTSTLGSLWAPRPTATSVFSTRSPGHSKQCPKATRGGYRAGEVSVRTELQL